MVWCWPVVCIWRSSSFFLVPSIKAKFTVSTSTLTFLWLIAWVIIAVNKCNSIQAITWVLMVILIAAHYKFLFSLLETNWSHRFGTISQNIKVIHAISLVDSRQLAIHTAMNVATKVGGALICIKDSMAMLVVLNSWWIFVQSFLFGCIIMKVLAWVVFTEKLSLLVLSNRVVLVSRWKVTSGVMILLDKVAVLIVLRMLLLHRLRLQWGRCISWWCLFLCKGTFIRRSLLDAHPRSWTCLHSFYWGRSCVANLFLLALLLFLTILFRHCHRWTLFFIFIICGCVFKFILTIVIVLVDVVKFHERILPWCISCHNIGRFYFV